ncbi:hypothetical protein KY284_013369 [Solanum tuberosum]|nr:hypothetical protein KY284_013369 [Solanum tuberosum]
MSGSRSFWWANWLGVGPLAQFTEDNNRFNNDTVSEFIEEVQWNINKIIQLASPTQVHNILATQLQLQQDIPNQPVWNLNCNGVFTCTSAWNSIREQRTKTKINTHTWHRNIPFKCFFLLWRALRGRLPTNEKLSNFGIEPANCLCCHPAGVDTIDHIFNAGIFAKKVWKFYVDSLGIQTGYIPLRYMIMRWWENNYKNEAHKLNLQSTPIFICWNLWKNRCAIKYEGKQSNIARVKFLVFKDTFKLLHIVFPYITWPSSWMGTVILIEKCFHETKVTFVQWMKPPDVWFKLNTDGSALDNPGSIGAREVEAAVFVLSWCVQLNYQKLVLEVDSQMLVDWLLNKSPLLGTSHHKCSSFTPLPLTSHISNTFTHSRKPTLWQIHSPNTTIKSPVPNYTSPASKFQKRQQLIFSRTRQTWQVSEERK